MATCVLLEEGDLCEYHYVHVRGSFSNLNRAVSLASLSKHQYSNQKTEITPPTARNLPWGPKCGPSTQIRVAKTIIEIVLGR